MITFKILSHACLLLKTDQASIIIDPWLVGSCYWRSWWNYPQPQFSEAEIADVDAVLISHVHWDHWHGPTMKKYFKEKLILIGDDPNPRSASDLQSIGCRSVKIIKHGRSYSIGDISITFYNFGLFLNDSAIVIESQGYKFLNANDAKLAGSALKRVKKRHGDFDFAFRSHSSANARICFSVVNDESYVSDERIHYLRSFKLFMDAVAPKYAVPFASNHCHLLSDGFQLNDYVSKPTELRSFLQNFPDLGWSFQMMVPGSEWSSSSGFTLRNQEAFDDYSKKLKIYQAEVSHRVRHYSNLESKVRLTDGLLNRFETMGRKGRQPRGSVTSFKFVLQTPNSTIGTLVWDGRQIQKVQSLGEEPVAGQPTIVMPAVVFRDAVIKNMFHHAAISKRCRFIAANQSDMRELQKFWSSLEMLELVSGDRFRYYLSLASRQVQRLGDLQVYLLAVVYRLLTRQPMYKIEEIILSRHSQ